jgi:hypothetical protein
MKKLALCSMLLGLGLFAIGCEPAKAPTPVNPPAVETEETMPEEGATTEGDEKMEDETTAPADGDAAPAEKSEEEAAPAEKSDEETAPAEKSEDKEE